MKIKKVSRREAIAQAGIVLGAVLASNSLEAAPASSPSAVAPTGDPFLFCLNTATIRGQNLGLVKEIEVAAQAGYQAIEPWVSSLEEHVKKGGSLKDVSKRLRDAGLTMESAIGFPEWIAEDDAKRAQGLERAKYEMDLVAQAGGKRLAAPPSGATNLPLLDLSKAAERYRALLEAGDQIGVVPQLELWGFSKNLHRLGQCAFVAIETGHPKACVLVDVYHIYKGGSDFHGMKLLASQAIHVMHMNDYPNDPPRDKINDSFRVYPGDGNAPLSEILRVLHGTGGQKVLSLEVFNRKYWEQDPLEVAKIGLEKMKAAAKQALG